MYLDVPHTLPMLIGGVAETAGRTRNSATHRRPQGKEGTTVAEKQRALILLSTFWWHRLADGRGVLRYGISILSFVDSLWYDDNGARTVMGMRTLQILVLGTPFVWPA